MYNSMRVVVDFLLHLMKKKTGAVRERAIIIKGNGEETARTKEREGERAALDVTNARGFSVPFKIRRRVPFIKREIFIRAPAKI